MNYPDLPPVIPIPGEILEDMAQYLDVSRSLLYLIVKKNHEPTLRLKQRICKNADLPLGIWEKPRHETVSDIYDAFRSATDIAELL